jgi:hypothetical protein
MPLFQAGFSSGVHSLKERNVPVSLNRNFVPREEGLRSPTSPPYQTSLFQCGDQLLGYIEIGRIFPNLEVLLQHLDCLGHARRITRQG